jgi:hypothetical protein
MEELNEPSMGIGARISHPSFGEGIIIDITPSTLTVFFKGQGDKEISRSFTGIEVIGGAKETSQVLDMAAIEKARRKVLNDESAPTRPVDMAEKWKGGTLEIKPGKSDLQSKEVPIDGLFHKIVMVRDRLRVLEQNINSHDKLDDHDKVHLQQYISRIYGSLTTFNVLFADKKDHFSSK